MSLSLSALVDESTFPTSNLLAADLTGQRITGARVVLEWILRSWRQPRGRNRLAPNAGADILELENASLEKLDLDRWRTRLRSSAIKASVGYCTDVDVTVTHADRTTSITGRAMFLDGSAHVLAVRIGAVGAAVKFGGTL